MGESFVTTKDASQSEHINDFNGKQEEENEEDLNQVDGKPIGRHSIRKELRGRFAEENALVKQASAASARERLRYLVSQADIFRHFVSGSSPQKLKQEPVQQGKPNKRRMTEKEEDELLMEAEVEGHQETTRLTTQPFNVRGTMRSYQLEGLNFLIGLYEHGLNGILADEMGLGKTLQTISLLAFLKGYRHINGPHLIIVPKSTLGNWALEFGKWCPDFNILRFHGSQDDRASLRDERLLSKDFDVCLTTYEVAIKEKNSLRRFTWRYVIIDEAHRIKNENSILSQVVRTFESQNRLLLTGTPLQNNLHELWALLNFLLPDIFASAEDFDTWFSSVESESENAKNEVVQQLHAVLRPFLIRRLKTEVEHDLPPKKETVLFTKLSNVQLEIYRNLLKKDIDAINGAGGDRVRLLNILMQLRKCCNHPYLFDGVEDRSLDPFGEHVIESCGKLVLLDKLLSRLRQGEHKVLIFSQMTRMLDILEDYCSPGMRNYPYCRIDGNTDGETRDAMIEDFNNPENDKFVFLLSTRAGGLGINLASADTVILYDSDWNPQVDLQAMDRAHRIGQKKPVNVYRLISENTVEERILRKALEKLKLDSLVIQQGRLVEQKKQLGKNDLLDMIRFGADKFFRADAGEYKNEDLDAILSRGETKTREIRQELDKRVETNGINMLQFSLSNSNSVYQFEGEDYRGKRSNTNNSFFLDVGKRERRKIYEDSEPRQTNHTTTRATSERPKQRLKPPKEPTLHDFQFFDSQRLQEIFEEEKKAVDEYNRIAEEAVKEGKEAPPVPELLPADKEQEKQILLSEGFGNWSRREFQAFVRGCERHGREAYEPIAAEIGSKSVKEVKEYAKAFWKYGPERIEHFNKIRRAIEEGEARIARREEMEDALRLKVSRYADPLRELQISYGAYKGKGFVEEEDRFLVCMTHKLGYGRWEELKMEIRKAWQFRFDWFIKSRTPLELRRRVDMLIRAIEKENDEYLERQSKKKNGKKVVKKSSKKKRKARATSRHFYDDSNMEEYFPSTEKRTRR
eukprot:jgi/Galph1/2511/GphlegSOOS_G1164.1